MFPALGKQRPRKRLSASRRGDFFDPGTGSSERGRELFSPSRQVSPPFTRLVQPLKAAPRSGHGRLPKAPRVHACETQPRAPHRPSGCPSGQLSLCPTSGSPLEAPLTGQDNSVVYHPRNIVNRNFRVPAKNSFAVPATGTRNRRCRCGCRRMPRAAASFKLKSRRLSVPACAGTTVTEWRAFAGTTLSMRLRFRGNDSGNAACNVVFSRKCGNQSAQAFEET